MCISVVASNFEDSPSFGALPEAYVTRIVEELNLNLPLELAGSVSKSVYPGSLCKSCTSFISLWDFNSFE